MVNLLKTGLLRSRRNTPLGSGKATSRDWPRQACPSTTKKYIGDVPHPTTGEKISMYVRLIRTLGKRGCQKKDVTRADKKKEVQLPSSSYFHALYHKGKPFQKEMQVVLPRGVFFERTVQIKGREHKYLYRQLTGAEKDHHVAKVLERIQKVRSEDVSDKQVPSKAEPVMASSTHQSVPPTTIELGKSTDLTPHLQSTPPLDAALSAEFIVQSQSHKSHLPPGAFERHLKVNGQTVTFIDRPATPAEERVHTRELLVRVGATQPYLARRFNQKHLGRAVKGHPPKDQLVVELKERMPTPPPEDGDNFVFGFFTGFFTNIFIMLIFS